MSALAQAFQEHEVVPDVVPVAPTTLVTVKYPSGAEVKTSHELTPTQVKDIPKLEWGADSNHFYTVCLTDPDNCTQKVLPPNREWHHWLVGNIPGGDVTKGETLSAYIGSGPPEGTGIHRYVFLVYKQPGKLQFGEPRLIRSVDNRAEFSIAKFAKKYNLGNPVAGNFYKAQFDDYVPQLYKELGA